MKRCRSAIRQGVPERFGKAIEGCGRAREMNLQGDIPALIERPGQPSIHDLLLGQAFRQPGDTLALERHRHQDGGQMAAEQGVELEPVLLALQMVIDDPSES